MSSNYKSITDHNERQLGLDTASRKTQICMYSDSTHFIYEILQNADDYGATEVLFRLSHSELVIEHNGKPFQEENVKAVTYFGRSTSRDDLVKTGRFGVGFKSVFAFTATPIIISGSEHFKIHGLYRVEEHPYPDGFSQNRTRITLPFNHESERPDYVDDLMFSDEAYEKIASRLSGLDMNTLLFTRNIREIRWEVEGKSGHYLRDDKPANGACSREMTDGDQVLKYLVYSRNPTWHGQSHKDVEIAFSIDKSGQVAPINDYLYVLFSTTQETHLQFIINGPYRTNPSRETISEDDSFNRHLIKETCTLLQSALLSLRDRGLLTTNCLAVMPNSTDRLREFYLPLFQGVIEIFGAEDLVPTDEDQFVSSQNVMQGPAQIREVITSKELAFLSATDGARWAKGVIQGSRSDQFLKSLKIGQWGWSELQEALQAKFEAYRYFDDDDDAKWLNSRPDPWMQKLYLLLAEAITKGEYDATDFQHCRIIRVTENKVINHVTGSKAYFPKGRGFQDLPQIKKSLLIGRTEQQTKKVEDALIALGAREIGDEERMDVILETYYLDDDSRPSPELHLEHMVRFIKWWKKEKSAEKFESATIFRVAGTDKFHDPSHCYLDSPLKSSGLDAIYKEERNGIPRRYKLWTKYKDLNGDSFYDFAIACGVLAELTIDEQSCSLHSKQKILLQDYYNAGARATSSGMNQDYTIEGIKALLKMRDRSVNLLIWNCVRNANPEVLEAVYCPNRKYKTYKEKSSLVIELSKADWIPDKKGVLSKPSAISKENLHSSFKYDNRNGWLDEIGFGEEALQASAEYQKKKAFAKDLGVNLEIVEQLGSFSKDEQKEFAEMLKRKARAKTDTQRKEQEAKPFHEALSGIFSQRGGEQPEESDSENGLSKNPARRAAKLQEEISNNIANEPSPESRFTFGLCKKWKGKNDQVKAKLTHWYAGKCQICERTFIQRNNEPYFEGLYLVPFTKNEWIDRPGNVLSLCSWHSAMFQFGSKQIDMDLLAHVRNFTPRAEGGVEEASIALLLCGEPATVVFHEDHFLELKVMILESQKIQN